MFYLTTHSTHFIYGYMASDIWLRTILILRKETRYRHIGYSYRLTARVLLIQNHQRLLRQHADRWQYGGARAVGMSCTRHRAVYRVTSFCEHRVPCYWSLCDHVYGAPSGVYRVWQVGKVPWAPLKGRGGGGGGATQQVCF